MAGYFINIFVSMFFFLIFFFDGCSVDANDSQQVIFPGEELFFGKRKKPK